MTVKDFRNKFPDQPMRFYIMGVQDITDFPIEKLDKLIPIGCGFNVDNSIDVEVKVPGYNDLCSHCDNLENDQWGFFCSLIPQSNKDNCDQFLFNETIIGGKNNGRKEKQDI